MIANCAFLAGLIMLLTTFSLMGQLEFLAPYKRTILAHDLWVLLGAAVVVFVNIFALAYSLTRRLFLKDTGRKLAHVERQLQTGDTIVRDLSDRLAREE
jgi:hypothetical protein